jgi:hypothetical protein
LEQAGGGYECGVHLLPVPAQTRQELYNRELDAFVGTITGQRAPDRPLAHELLVQETLLRSFK